MKYFAGYFFLLILFFIPVISCSDPNTELNTELNTEFLATIYEENTSQVMLLLEKGADVNAKGNDGFTALMVGSLQGRTEIVKILLEKGADVNEKGNDGFTALMIAS